MSTLSYNSTNQLVVTIDDHSLVKKVTEAIKLLKGVSSVKAYRLEDDVLNSPSYKAAMRDIKDGNVTTYASSDEMFKDLMES